MKKQLLSLFCAIVLVLGLMVVPTQAAETPVTMSAQGWYETICAELTGVTDSDDANGDVTAVSYTDESGTKTTLTGDDFKYLVRNMTGGGVRIDIPGVKPGTYSLSVTAKGVTYTAWNLVVKAYDRSGFAHKVHTTDASGNITGIKDYTEGVGAYNDDGTLKDNATVLYVTEENKETVSLTVGDITVTGIGNILNCKGYDQKHGKTKLLLKLSDANRPLVVRIVGDVTKPAGVTVWDSTDYGGSADDNGGMCLMEYVGNITIEGVGPDATVNGWGFSFSADGTGRTALGNKRANCGQNIEVRNLTFRNVPEDCVSLTGSQKKDDQTSVVTLTDSIEHSWVHNNAFYGPKDLPDASSDGDKSEGDGAVDFRNGEYMTLSYNYFDDYHKTSLIGAGNDNPQYHVTWHHNWWKNVQSRMPLCRQADVHIYNNLYEVEANYAHMEKISYCMSLRASCYVFSEYNTFLNCRNPILKETKHAGGGACKSWQDVFTDCYYAGSEYGSTTLEDHATIADSKSQKVDSTNLYPNFDTDPKLSYIPSGDYALQEDAAEAEATVRAEAGPMKAELPAADFAAAEQGDLGQLKWVYTEEGDVLVLGGIPAGAKLFVAGYEDTGRCAKVAEIKDGKAALGAGVSRGKLFWLGAQDAPQCQAGGWEPTQG